MSEVDYDDLLFAEADRWVRAIEKSNWVPTSQASTIFPDGQQRNMSDLLGDALNAYKEFRRQYRASLLAFSKLDKILKEANQEHEQSDNARNRKKNPDGTVSPEVAVEWFLDEPRIWEDLRRESIEVDYHKVLNSFEPLRHKKREAARTLLHVIERAKMSGAIKNARLTQKLVQCEIDFRQLSDDYKALVEKNKRLEEEKNFRSGHVKPLGGPPNQTT